MPATEFTSINRGWSMKMVIFMVVLFGFGIWGLYDATILYPQRGIDDASLKQKEYLEYIAQSNQFSAASIGDPVAKLNDLKKREAELKEADIEARRVTPGGPEYRALLPKLVDVGAANWLKSLRMVGRLKPEFTMMTNPSATLAELREKWNTTAHPNPLTEYDIPLQWLFAALGFGLGLYILWIFFRVVRTRYGWDPAIQELTFPDGKTIVPADVAEFDKRKWDKFYVTLNFKGGGARKLDLLRYVPLEEWILAMERTAFPETAPPEEPAPPAPADGASPEESPQATT